jgi:hypothetical protein
MYQSIRPMSGIIQTLHTLKDFYSIVPSTDQHTDVTNSSLRTMNKKDNIVMTITRIEHVLDDYRLSREQIIDLRRYMLLFMKQLVISSSGTQEDELDAILNYLHTIHQVCEHGRIIQCMFQFYCCQG